MGLVYGLVALLGLVGAGGGAAAQASPHQNGDMRIFEAPRMAEARPDPGAPAGSVRVEVRDARGNPEAGAEVQVGVMRPDGKRSAETARTDAEGRATFDGLDTGSKAAYRVNLAYQGAKLSSTPFRLPDDTGYLVRLQKLPVSTDPRIVFQMLGQTTIEFKDDRVHVTQQARLTNVGGEVYVFPRGGQRVKFPAGYLSPQFQKVMTDQELTEVEGEGLAIRGSLPPGTVTLTWAYDLRTSGSELRIPVDLPIRTYMYRVIAEAPEGLSLHATGMPEAQRFQDQGRDLLVTQIQRGPQDAPLKAITLRLEGIPGPGPGRWVAVALALTALGFAVYAGLRPGEGDAVRLRLVQRHKAELLAQAEVLESQRASGEIGPEFHAERVEALTRALALALRDEQQLTQQGQPS